MDGEKPYSTRGVITYAFATTLLSDDNTVQVHEFVTKLDYMELELRYLKLKEGKDEEINIAVAVSDGGDGVGDYRGDPRD